MACCKGLYSIWYIVSFGDCMRIVGRIPFKAVSSEALKAINKEIHDFRRIQVIIDGDRCELLLLVY